VHGEEKHSEVEPRGVSGFSCEAEEIPEQKDDTRGLQQVTVPGAAKALANHGQGKKQADAQVDRHHEFARMSGAQA
jgi:hypothetical protein